MLENFTQRHAAQRSATNADQAEFFALKRGSANLDLGSYDDRLAGVLDELEPDKGVEPWQRDDLRNDTAVGHTQEEVERRISLLRSAYPFRLDGGTLSYEGGNACLYEFLLCICNATLTSGAHVELPRVFERVAAKLVAAYFGARARSIHTGSPRDRAVGTSFRKAMQTVSEETGEWTWGPDEGLPADPPQQRDEGCDFVVWLQAADGRQIGQLFVLGQCACGNDWDTKYRDLDLARLKRWFNPLSDVQPLRSFATPHHVIDVLLREASQQSGLFFDRARLTLIAANGGRCFLRTAHPGRDEPADRSCRWVNLTRCHRTPARWLRIVPGGRRCQWLGICFSYDRYPGI